MARKVGSHFLRTRGLFMRIPIVKTTKGLSILAVNLPGTMLAIWHAPFYSLIYRSLLSASVSNTEDGSSSGTSSSESARDEKRHSRDVERDAQRVQPVPAPPQPRELLLILLGVHIDDALVDREVAQPGGGEHAQKAHRSQKRAPEPRRPTGGQHCQDTRDDGRAHPEGHDRPNLRVTSCSARIRSG